MEWMILLQFIQGIGAACICLGFRVRKTGWLFIIPYWYMFLLDKTHWNNHSYLFGLMGLIFTLTDRNVVIFNTVVIQNNALLQWGPFSFIFVTIIQRFHFFYIRSKSANTAVELLYYSISNISAIFLRWSEENWSRLAPWLFNGKAESKMGFRSISSNFDQWANWSVHCPLGRLLSRHDIWTNVAIRSYPPYCHCR